MGLMDKAKKLAEQAQEKLDEAQQQFNSGGSTGGQQEGGGVRYDEHGRPIEGPPAGEAAPPSRQPAADPGDQPTTPSGDTEPGDAKPGDANPSPDPFKPIQ
jgi:hypothetical protein